MLRICAFALSSTPIIALFCGGCGAVGNTDPEARIAEALPPAVKSIDSGGAAGKLDALVRFTNAYQATSS